MAKTSKKKKELNLGEFNEIMTDSGSLEEALSYLDTDKTSSKRNVFNEKTVLSDVTRQFNNEPFVTELDAWFAYPPSKNWQLGDPPILIARRQSFVSTPDQVALLHFIFDETLPHLTTNDYPVSEKDFEQILKNLYLTYEDKELNDYSICRPLLPEEFRKLQKTARFMKILKLDKTPLEKDEQSFLNFIEKLELLYRGNGIPITKVEGKFAKKRPFTPEDSDQVEAFVKGLLEDFTGTNEEDAQTVKIGGPQRNNSLPAKVKVIPDMSDIGNAAALKKIRTDYGDLENEELAHFMPENIPAARQRLFKDYPHCSDLIDRLLQKPARLSQTGRFLIKPTLIHGAPGSGKTTFAKRFFAELGFQGKNAGRHVNLAGVQDDHILGVSQGWSTSMPSMVLREFQKQKICNPVFIMDELDKSSFRSKNSSIMDRFLPLLEPSENGHWTEPYLGTEIDASQVNWVFTANDLSMIPDFLLSRLDVVQMPTARLEHLPTVVKQLLEEILIEAELSMDWMPKFSSVEMDSLKSNWLEHKNLRILKKQVEFLYADYERKTFRNVN